MSGPWVATLVEAVPWTSRSGVECVRIKLKLDGQPFADVYDTVPTEGPGARRLRELEKAAGVHPTGDAKEASDRLKGARVLAFTGEETFKEATLTVVKRYKALDQ